MGDPSTDADVIRARGWRQGSLLRPVELPLEFRPDPPLHEDALLYVLTHDCDLVQTDFEKEPYVEFLVISPIQQIDGNFAFGRHPRLLDFQILEAPFRVCCHDRITLSRSILAQLEPVQDLPVDDYVRDLIAEWVSKRYIRPAFPDEFNRRLAEQGKRIQQFCKKFGHNFSQIYIHCTPERDELPAGDSYDLTVWMVLIPITDPGDAQSLARDLAKILEGCPDIRVDDCRLVTEDDVTLAHLRIFSPWDFDYLTHREPLHHL